jgi:hypothetical protein
MTLYILSVCIPGGPGWQEPQVFEPDPNQDPNEQNEKTTLLDQEEKRWKEQGCSTNVQMICGMSVNALSKYFANKEQQ